MATMPAALATGLTKIQCDEIPIPDMESGKVLVKSKLSSICGDFCSGKIWALRYDGQNVTEHIEVIDSRLGISSFGEDQQGRLYILSFDEHIYRFAED